MQSRLRFNTRSEKLAFLKAVAAGKVDPKALRPAVGKVWLCRDGVCENSVTKEVRRRADIPDEPHTIIVLQEGQQHLTGYEGQAPNHIPINDQP